METTSFAAPYDAPPLVVLVLVLVLENAGRGPSLVYLPQIDQVRTTWVETTLAFLARFFSSTSTISRWRTASIVHASQKALHPIVTSQ